MKRSSKQHLAIAAMAILLLAAGCAKKNAAPPPPPPPPPPAPSASLSANPDTIEAGRSTQLTWQTQNATDVNIEGVGAVGPNGSQAVTPATSTTYKLIARGPGGTQEATARVTVGQRAAPAPQISESDQQLFARNVQDIFFDYDSFDLRPEAQPQLASAAQFLQQHLGLAFTIEGHCDERGSTEYNLALGDSRAAAVKDALARAGVSGGRMRTVSFGKEKPFCNQSNEQCWQQNRRAHFVLQR